MGAPRFLTSISLSPALAGSDIALDADAAHHATRVLRLAVGDAVTLFDGTGGEYEATLVRADKRGAAVRVERFLPVERESPFRVTLAQAIVASDAMDSLLRKATELGVAAIQPMRKPGSPKGFEKVPTLMPRSPRSRIGCAIGGLPGISSQRYASSQST